MSTLQRYEIHSSTPVLVWTNDIEVRAKEQLINLSKLPFIHSHVAAMPDVHSGIGATVGTVIATDKAIIPAAVGVDIGCGMYAVKTNIRANDLTESIINVIYDKIIKAVPVGKSQHTDKNARYGVASSFKAPLDLILQRHPNMIDSLGKNSNWINQIGTLGGGNHFIELCLDESDDVWVMLHSGSRGIGNAIGTYFIDLARKDMQRYFINLPDKDLAYIPEGSVFFNDYIDALSWAQEYAYSNRDSMLRIIFMVLKSVMPEFKILDQVISCHHNYVARENHYGKNVWVTRKGAIRAREGDLGIIPGSMGTKSYIVRGKGNPGSFNSCSHGAGRKMSRAAASNSFTLADIELQTQGVCCRKDIGVVDEIPGAYKDIDTDMENQKDLVEIVHTLKQFLCIKW